MSLIFPGSDSIGMAKRGRVHILSFENKALQASGFYFPLRIASGSSFAIPVDISAVILR
jgi:hypothetical protein